MEIIKQSFKCIDAHTCGNPVRVVIDNKPELEGASMDDKRHDFEQRYDWIRQGLMFEPRGHDAMSGSIIYPPDDPAYDLSILFIEVSEDGAHRTEDVTVSHESDEPSLGEHRQVTNPRPRHLELSQVEIIILVEGDEIG